MKHLEAKIFITSLLLIDLLDETQGKNKFKHKLRYQINQLSKSLEEIVDIELTDDNVSLLLTDAWASLEATIDGNLREVTE